MDLHRPLRLLLVDPDQSVRAALERLIRRQKLPYVLEVAPPGHGAGRRLPCAPCDAVLADCTNGDAPGLKSLDEAGQAPVILLLDRSRQESAIPPPKPGAYPYPVDTGDDRCWWLLPAVVEHAVASHHTLAGLREAEQHYRRIAESSSRQLGRQIARRESAEQAWRASEERVRGHLDELAHLARLTTMSQMATGLAHELKQPLSAIANYAQACRYQVDDRNGKNHGPLLGYLEEIAEQANRAGEIIRHLRAFVRRTEAQRSSVDINQLVQDLVVLLEVQARLHDVRLELALDRRLPRARVDRVQIEQVVTNLVNNAVEAIEELSEGPRDVIIRTSINAAGLIEVAVEDTGKGIPTDQIDQLFEPFYTTKGDGTGLGLAISRWIIEAHGGRLEAAPRPERGTTFRFSLPAEDPGGQP